MRLFFLLNTLFMLSACMSSPEIAPSNEKETTSKINTNKTDADLAQSEYKALQEQRAAQ